MNKKTALQLAKSAISSVTTDSPEPVADTTVLFLNPDGAYSVCDNGEEVAGLSAAEAIRIMVENLAGRP